MTKNLFYSGAVFLLLGASTIYFVQRGIQKLPAMPSLSFYCLIGGLFCFCIFNLLNKEVKSLCLNFSIALLYLGAEVAAKI